MKFTKAQLSDWKRYENVRNGGRWNMWFPQARAATGLSGERYSFVMEHFSELKDAAEAKSEKTGRQRRSNDERNTVTEQTPKLEEPATSVSSDLLGELESTLNHANALSEILRQKRSVNWYRMLPILETLRDMSDDYERNPPNDEGQARLPESADSTAKERNKP